MRKLVVILVIATIAGGSAYLWWKQDAERRQRASLQRSQPKTETAQASTTRPATATVRKPAADPGTPAPPLTERAAAIRKAVPAQYPDIARELNLTPQETERLFDVIARQQSEAPGRTLFAAAGDNDGKQRANEAELSAVLGSKFRPFRKYQESLPIRRQVIQLQRALAGSGADLGEAKARSLIAALATEQARINQEASASITQGRTPQEALEEQLQRNSDVNRRLLGVASSHLDSRQLDGYRKLLEQQEKRMRAIVGGDGLPGQ